MRTAIDKAKSFFLRGDGNGFGFLTNIVSATTGDTTLALVKHIGDDSYEAILPADVYYATHLIRVLESPDHVPARIKAVCDQGHVDLFDLRLSPKGMYLNAVVQAWYIEFCHH